MTSNIEGVDLGREVEIALPPNFEIYSKHQKTEKYDLNLPDRIGMNNPKINPSFISHEIHFGGLRMDRIEKRSLNVPDEEEFQNIEQELKLRKHEAEVMSNKFNDLQRQHEEMVRSSHDYGSVLLYI